MLTEFVVKFDASTSPREAFVAQRVLRIGRIDGERAALERLRDRVLEVQALIEEKAELQKQIGALRDRLRTLQAASARRRSLAMSMVSDIARDILRQDLERQVEFRNAQAVAIKFADNSVMVDGVLNFAESSNVILKNTAILSLLLGATQDRDFYHPQFILMDNIEDKGMEQVRSHNFQEIVARASESADIEHQIIFTTSMISPELDDERYTIGPYYTHDGDRSLALPKGIADGTSG